MHHTVAHGINLLQVLDDTNLRVGQQGEDKLHTLSMLGNVMHNLLLLSIRQLHLYKAAL